MNKIFALAAAALLTGTAPPVHAEVVSTEGDMFVVAHEAATAASTMDTWIALTKPGEWWSSSHTWSADAANMTLTPQAGGCFCERIPEGTEKLLLEGSVQHMVVVQAYPERTLRMRGGLGPLQGEPAEGVLTITLKAVNGGTAIRWEYVVGGPMRFEVPTIAKAVDGVIGEQLERLVAHLGPLDSAGE